MATETSSHPSAPAPDLALNRAVPPMLLAGLEPVRIDDSSLFVNVGERTNVTGSKAFARMILNASLIRPCLWPASRSRTAPR
jgi:hypothetical protein